EQRCVSTPESARPGRVPDVVTLAKKSPATHLLVVHHYDRVGVLSAVFRQLKHAGINVQETENMVFAGATAAVARIHLDSAPPQGALDAMRAESPDIIELSVLKLSCVTAREPRAGPQTRCP